VSQKRLRKNLNSDDHFDRPFSFMAMKGKPQQQLEQKKYENSKCNKLNSRVAFATHSACHCTGAGHHRRVDSWARPGNARLRV
jgi:hypothetical protein